MISPGGSILAVHCGALGDCILFGQLLSYVSYVSHLSHVSHLSQTPGEVTLVAPGRAAKLLAGMGVVAAAVDFDLLPIHEVFSDEPLDRCSLPGLVGRHDRLISCFAGGSAKAELRLAAMCGAATACFLPVRPSAETRGHLLELWCDMLGLADCPSTGAADRPGCRPAGRPAPWPVPKEWRDRAGEAVSEATDGGDGPYFVIHPGAGSPAKCWPVESYAALAERLERLGQTVFVTGPVEADRWPRDTIDMLAARGGLLRSPSLEVLAGVLAGAAGYVGNDSGVSHLAAAVAAPTVALFGPTRAEHFAPLGKAVRTIQAAALEKISVDAAFDAIVELAGRPGRAGRAGWAGR